MVLGSHQHRVRFYDRDDELVAELTGVVVEAMARAQPMLCVATPAHREALESLLTARGVDVRAACASGAYRPHDAADTLSLFMRGGHPDPQLFESSVGALLEDASALGRPMVYGEMVALLWERGEHDAALELEELWNDLAGTRDFNLLCAYPTTALETASLAATNRVCATHTHVLAPGSYDTAPAPPVVPGSLVMVAVPEAVPAARRFVAATLPADLPSALRDDAELVVSELATNAVRHAGSAFRLSVQDLGSGVRVTVQDSGEAVPRERHPSPDEHGGRGVAIVSKLASRWGYDLLGDGKVVWAELVDA